MARPPSPPPSSSSSIGPGKPTATAADGLVVTCTFCWQSAPPPPHVVGRAARIACGPCYRALLDLAVCWACGEVVFRGDECVSLGWCFWHRACYGCLLCGSGLVCQGVGVAELFEGGGEVVGGERGGDVLGRGKGREVEQIPLCGRCVWEVSVDGLDQEAVVERGLKRIDQADGGLSRRRREVNLGNGGVSSTFKKKSVEVRFNALCGPRMRH